MATSAREDRDFIESGAIYKTDQYFDRVKEQVLTEFTLISNADKTLN